MIHYKEVILEWLSKGQTNAIHSSPCESEFQHTFPTPV